MKQLAVLALALLAGCRESVGDRAHTIARDVSLEPGVVRATGRWVTEHKSVGPLLARVNSVDLVCRQETMSCSEALAALVTRTDEPRLSRELLLSYLAEYRVESWTAESIRAKLEQPVADVTLEIDLKSQEFKRTHQETRARGDATANPERIIVWLLR